MYRKRHDGEYPKKVSYTLWSGEFIETGGATIAQVLYMLGVEPVRDAFGRVSDLKLIPPEELDAPHRCYRADFRSVAGYCRFPPFPL